MGEGDWKSMTIEDPAGQVEKRTGDQIAQKWREMKHWLQKIDTKGQATADEGTQEHRNLLIIMKAILSTEEPVTAASQPAKASEDHKEFPIVEEKN